MPVDKFGSDGKVMSVSKNYVDSKFITLARNDNLKFDKTGGKMFGDIDMDGRRILSIKNPENEMDVVNKRYVDNAVNVLNEKINAKQEAPGAAKFMIKSNVGLVPHLTERIDRSGYIVEESSKFRSDEFAGFKAFNVLRNNSGWRVDDNIYENFWIKIRCTQPETIYRISVRAAGTSKIKRWQLQGTTVDDGYHPWDVLIDSDITIQNISEGNTVKQYKTQFFDIDPTLINEYVFYKLYVLESEGINPGLSHLQFYTLNKILTL